MTDRNRAVIKAVCLYGAVSGSQLQSMKFFDSRSRRNRCLRRLFDAGYLRRVFVASGSYAAEAIYLLGTNGVAIAAEETSLDPIELARQARRVPQRMFLEHHLAVVDIRLAAERISGDVRLVRFLSEPECRHEYEVALHGRAHRRLIKPDALALFEGDGERLPVFIEMDRGHVSLPQMAGVFERYGHYWTDGAFTDAYKLEEPFTVAVITTAGRRRINHLRELAGRAQVPVSFATFDALRRSGFFGRIWTREARKVGEHLWQSATGGCVGDRQ